MWKVTVNMKYQVKKCITNKFYQKYLLIFFMPQPIVVLEFSPCAS